MSSVNNNDSWSNEECEQDTRQFLRSNQQPKLTTAYKIGRVITLFLLWMCFGAFSEITGPVMPELIAQTHSGYEAIAQAISMRGAGHALGGIVGGFAVDRMIHYIDICVAVVLVAYTIIGVWAAYIQSIPLLYIVFFIQGSLETWLLTAGVRIAFLAWKEKSAGPLHALSMGYGIGSMIAPQLVAPFLNPRLSAGAIPTAYQSTCREDNSSHNIISSTTSRVSTSATHDQSSPTYPAKFVTAYWIISGLSMSLACLFVGYHIHSRVTSISIDGNSQIRIGQQDKKNFKESISLKTCSATHPRYAGLIIVCLFAYYVVSVPLFRTFSKFIFSYARDGPCLTIQAATTLESAYFAAVTVGRLCAFLCSYVIHMKYILQVEVIGVLITATILYFFHTNVTILWIFCSALGFFTGPIKPSAFAWANRYIEVTSTAQIIPQIGAAVGDVTFMVLVGYSYEKESPYVLWSYQLILCGAICAVAWVMQAFGSLHGDRYKSPKI